MIDAPGDALRWSGVALPRGRGRARPRAVRRARPRCSAPARGGALPARRASTRSGCSTRRSSPTSRTSTGASARGSLGHGCALRPGRGRLPLRLGVDAARGPPDPFFCGLPRAQLRLDVCSRTIRGARCCATRRCCSRQPRGARLRARPRRHGARAAARAGATRRAGCRECCASGARSSAARRVGRRELERADHARAAAPVSRVAVVIPTWNGRELLDAALRSLGEQRFADFSVIVVDNGSTRRHRRTAARAPTRRSSVVSLAENRGVRGGGQRGDRAARDAELRRAAQQRHGARPGLARGARRRAGRRSARGLGGEQAADAARARDPRRRRGPRYVVRRDLAARPRRARPRAVRRAGRRREPVRRGGALPGAGTRGGRRRSTSASSPTSRTPTGACAHSSPAGTAVWVPGAVAYHLGGATSRPHGRPRDRADRAQHARARR